MYKVRVEKGVEAGTEFPLAEGANVIGRSQSASIRLLSGDVSGKHALVKVEGGRVTVENLSRFGSLINDQPVKEARPWGAGQRLTLTSDNVLILIEEGSGHGGGHTADELPTMDLAVPDTAASGSDRKEPDAARDPSATMASVDPSTQGGTVAMQTRAAGVEELEHLKQEEVKKAALKFKLTVAGAFAVLVLAFVLWPRPEPPERVIKWPRDARGEYLDALVSAPSAGLQDGGYAVGFPGTEGWTSSRSASGVIIETRIGRALDVPLKITLQEQEDTRNLTTDRMTAFKEWTRQVAAEGGQWNFDAPFTGEFVGSENGIPCISVAYNRSDASGAWFGNALFLRHGRKRIVLRKEVPLKDMARAEELISKKMLNVSRNMERTFWEGRADLPAASAADLLKGVRGDVERMTPGAWCRVESGLLDAVRKAAVDGNKDVESEALRLLLRLREQEALWFNSQRLAKYEADAQKDERMAAAVSELCKAVFSNMDDKRFYEVRRSVW